MSKSYATTYCDGDQAGCSWAGTQHQSASNRSAQYRGGGRVRDFEDDWDVGVIAMEGWGMPGMQVAATDYAILPGGTVHHIKPTMRQWQLVFDTPSPSLTSVHTLRDYLVEAFKPDRVAPPQPVRLQYTGASTTTTLEIDAWYVGGLEGSIVGREGVMDAPVVRLLSEDPFFYALGNTAATLDVNDSLTVAPIVERLPSGTWSAMGAPATSNGTSINVLAMDNNGNLYVGGTFANFDGNANADNIVMYSNAGVWTPLSTGLSAVVGAIAIASDGSVYIGGLFTNAGDANGDYIIKWTGSAWVSLGTGANEQVQTIAIGNDGSVYIGGVFTLAGGIANTVNIAKWDGSVWSALGTGMNGTVNSICIGLDGSLYATGAFTTAGGVTVNRIAKWDGTTWSALGSGLDATGHGVFTLPDGRIAVGGDFTTANGVSCLRVAIWNGTTFSPLGSGCNNIASSFAWYEGRLLIAGQFTSAGGLALSNRMAAWTGTTWQPMDIELPTGAYVNGIEVSDGGALYIGFYIGVASASGTAYVSSSTTVSNDGSRMAYPRIYIKRSGGTTARLSMIQNETTTTRLVFSYALQDGEEILIDLTPGAKSITSTVIRPITIDIGSQMAHPAPLYQTVDYYVVRKRTDIIGRALLPGSDFGSFSLAPGDNVITAYVYEAGAPTVTAYLTYRNSFWSLDGAVS